MARPSLLRQLFSLWLRQSPASGEACQADEELQALEAQCPPEPEECHEKEIACDYAKVDSKCAEDGSANCAVQSPARASLDTLVGDDEAPQTKARRVAFACIGAGVALGQPFLGPVFAYIDRPAGCVLFLALLLWSALVSSGIIAVSLVLAREGGEAPRPLAPKLSSSSGSSPDLPSSPKHRPSPSPHGRVPRVAFVLVTLTSVAAACFTALLALSVPALVFNLLRLLHPESPRDRAYIYTAAFACSASMAAGALIAAAYMTALVRSRAGAERQRVRRECLKLVRGGLHAALAPAHALCVTAAALLVLLWMLGGTMLILGAMCMAFSKLVQFVAGRGAASLALSDAGLFQRKVWNGLILCGLAVWPAATLSVPVWGGTLVALLAVHVFRRAMVLVVNRETRTGFLGLLDLWLAGIRFWRCSAESE